MVTHRRYNIWWVPLLCLFAAMFFHDAFGAQDTATQTNRAHLIVVYPASVTADDCITITFPKQHPKKMSVRSPSGEWFVVHEKSEEIFLLPYNKFSRATSIQKRASEFRGVKWVGGQRIVGPVFNEPGEYLFYMADNLETEPENTFHMTGMVIYK